MTKNLDEKKHIKQLTLSAEFKENENI